MSDKVAATKVRPLKATYSPIHPYEVERHDFESGLISFEIWDKRPDSYRRLCSVTEHSDSLRGRERRDANLIALALNLANEMDWRPIDTAPKDGTRILAYAPNAPGGPRQRVTWWRQASDGAGYIGWGEFNAEHWPPTHWMSLPAPPVEERRSREPKGKRNVSERSEQPT